MTAAFSTTSQVPVGPGQPIDATGPSVGFLRKDVSADFRDPEVMRRRFEARKQVVDEVGQRVRDDAAYVAAHSLLNTGVGLDCAARRLSPQLLTHGFDSKDLDHLLALSNLASSALKSSFEGWSHFRASTWWSQVIDSVDGGGGLFSRAHFPPAIGEALRTLTETARATESEKALLNPVYVKQQADNLMAAILALPPGQSFCMAGGWAARPNGHAMVYRFERNPAGLFNVFVYNPWGPELEGGRRIEGMLNSRPCYVFENVSSEDLFFTSERPGYPPDPPPNSTMLQRLLELKAEPKAGGKNLGMEDVLNCFCRLKPCLVPGNKFRNLFLRTQRAGNCAIKSVNCLLLDLLGDKTVYKKLILDERLLSLLVYRQSFCQPPFNQRTPDGRLDVRMYLRQFALLRRATRNFLTILEKNYKNGTITPAELPLYEQAFATAKGIIDELQGREKAVLQQRQTERGFVSEAVPGSRPSLAGVGEVQWRGQGATALANVGPPARQPASQFTVNAGLGLRAAPQDLPAVLRGLKDTMTEAARSGYHQAAIAQFELTMGHLFATTKGLQGPDGKVRLAGLGQGLAPGIQADLLDSLQIYSESVSSQNGTPSTRVQNAGMAAMALSYVLGCWAEAGTPQDCLSRFGVYTRHFEQMSCSDEAVFAPLDGAAVEQRNALIDFWRRVNSNVPRDNELFNFNTQRVDSDAVRTDRLAELVLYKNYQPAIQTAAVHESSAIKGIDRFAQQRVQLLLTLSQGTFPPAMAHIGALKEMALLAFGLFVPGVEKLEANHPWLAHVCDNGDLHYISDKRQWRANGDAIHYTQMEEADYPGSVRKKYNWQKGKHDPLPEGRYSKYTTNLQHRHVQGQDGIQSENALLNMMPEAAPERDLALCEPDVQTSLLFGVIENNLPDLSKPEWRSYIETEFFKTVDVAGRTVSPLCDQLRDDDALIHKLDHLTDHCMKQLVEATPRDPKWQEMLFIIRLRANVLANKTRIDPAYRLSRQPPGLNSVEINERILNWLRDYDATLARELLDPALVARRAERSFAKTPGSSLGPCWAVAWFAGSRS